MLASKEVLVVVVASVAAAAVAVVVGFKEAEKEEETLNNIFDTNRVLYLPNLLLLLL